MDLSKLPPARWPPPSFEVEEEAAFDGSSDEEEAIKQARRGGPAVVKKLRGVMGSLHHCVYPHGSVTIATDEELHELGLQIDTSLAAANAFKVHRESYGGEFDVVAFSAQPRMTMVCFLHDQHVTDAEVALRARAILQRDIEWCQADTSSDDEMAGHVHDNVVSSKQLARGGGRPPACTACMPPDSTAVSMCNASGLGGASRVPAVPVASQVGHVPGGLILDHGPVFHQPGAAASSLGGGMCICPRARRTARQNDRHTGAGVGLPQSAACSATASQTTRALIAAAQQRTKRKSLAGLCWCTRSYRVVLFTHRLEDAWRISAVMRPALALPGYYGHLGGSYKSKTRRKSFFEVASFNDGSPGRVLVGSSAILKRARPCRVRSMVYICSRSW